MVERNQPDGMNAFVHVLVELGTVSVMRLHTIVPLIESVPAVLDCGTAIKLIDTAVLLQLLWEFVLKPSLPPHLSFCFGFGTQLMSV